MFKPLLFLRYIPFLPLLSAIQKRCIIAGFCFIIVSPVYAQTSPNAVKSSQELLELPNAAIKLPSSSEGSNAPKETKPAILPIVKPAAPLPPITNDAVIKKDSITENSLPDVSNPAADKMKKTEAVPAPAIIHSDANTPIPQSVLQAASLGLEKPVKEDFKPFKEVKKSENSYQDIHHDSATSLMFNKQEMEIIKQLIEMYDKQEVIDAKNPDAKKEGNDSFSDLFNLIKQEGNNHEEKEKILPNIYLGSIIYHSPTQWVAMVNGVMIDSDNNNLQNSFYIKRVSRKAVELVWKPKNFNLLSVSYKNLSDREKANKVNIMLDNKNASVTLLLMPNQTFISKEVSIKEGFVKQILPEIKSETANNKLENKAEKDNPLAAKQRQQKMGITFKGDK